MAIHILIDSGCDMNPDEAKKAGIEIIPLKVYFGEEGYIDNVNMSHDEFFEKLIETDVLPTTSQVSPFEYEEKFRELTANGDKVLCLTISAALSGCFQSANIAAAEFENQVMVVDTENACIGERVLAEYAVNLRNQGMNIEQIASKLNEEKKKVRVIALLDTLEYLKKGGRISPAVAMAGSLLSIKPVIAVVNGEVALLGKARGSKAANNKLHELVEGEEGICFDKPACLAYSGLNDTLLKKYVKDHMDLYEKFDYELPVSSIGCAIGTHVGPGAIAVAFFVQ